MHDILDDISDRLVLRRTCHFESNAEFAVINRGTSCEWQKRPFFCVCFVFVFLLG